MTAHRSMLSMLKTARVGERPAKKDGAGDRDRTGDIQLGKLTFCH